MKYTTVVSLLLCITVQHVFAVRFEENSFGPPYEAFNSAGKRVLEGWKFGGDAAVKENFVRLTPDRQSKRGWAVCSKPIQEQEFTIYVRFRISGKGKTLFGDGMAVWVTQKPKARFEPGLLMGSTSEFVGFGVMFDTFRNLEADHVHKDISLVFSDGSSVTLDTERPGCDSKYRHYEGREDFTPGESESRAKITFKNGIVSVEIDPEGNDDWVHCFNSNIRREFKPPKGWMKDLRYSVSASTGALADNHDILEFTVTKPDDISKYMELKEVNESEPAVIVDVRPNIRAHEVGENLNDLSYEVKDVQDKVGKMNHNMEHKLENFKYEIENMIKALQEQEEADEARIAELEEKQRKSMEASLDRRISDLEKKLTGNIETRLNKLEMKVARGINSVETRSGAWKVPLVVIVVLLGIVFYMNSRSIRKLQNRDKFF